MPKTMQLKTATAIVLISLLLNGCDTDSTGATAATPSKTPASVATVPADTTTMAATGPVTGSDALEFTSVTTDSALADGRSTAFTVTIRWTLKTATKGMLIVATNNNPASSLKTVNQKILSINQGSGTSVIHFTTAVKDWGSTDAFGISALIYPDPYTGGDYLAGFFKILIPKK